MSERFKLPADDEMTPEQAKVAKAIIDSPRKGIRGPFPALLRRPKMADATRLLGDCIRYDSSLSDSLREFAILIVVRHWNVAYEWAAHSKIALDAGLEPGVLKALETGQRPTGLDREQSAAYDVSLELLDRQELSDACYDQAMEVFGEVGLVDLIGTIAYYNYISVLLNAIAKPVTGDVKSLDRIR